MILEDDFVIGEWEVEDLLCLEMSLCWRKVGFVTFSCGYLSDTSLGTNQDQALVSREV